MAKYVLRCPACLDSKHLTEVGGVFICMYCTCINTLEEMDFEEVEEEEEE